jgi:3-dehydroquinate synthase
VGHDLSRVVARDLATEPLGQRYALITDHQVLGLHGKSVAEALRQAGLTVDILAFPEGEEHKNRETLARLVDGMVELELGRDAAVLAVGGGVVGDVAGFAAAIFHRGIPYLQIPTTLLAMVDSSIGGKTGHDLPGGKNLVGAFHQPAGVYVDLSFLETLPPPALRDGFAEVIKHAAIADADLATVLEERAAGLLAREPEPLLQAVTDSVRIKASVVSSDPLEAGRRAILNFGHTVGHAVESASGYRVSHGQAVAQGMMVECTLSERRGLLSAAAAGRVRQLLVRFGLEVLIPRSLPAELLWSACRRDKKARRGEVRCVLLRDVGEVARSGESWTFAVHREEVVDALEACAAPAG